MKNQIKNVSVLAKIKSMPVAVKIISGVAATCLVTGTIATVLTVTKNEDSQNLKSTSAEVEITEMVGIDTEDEVTVTEKEEPVVDSEITDLPETGTTDADKSDVPSSGTTPAVTTPTVTTPTVTSPSVTTPSGSNPSDNKPTVTDPTPSVVPTVDYIESAMQRADDAYLSLGYFEDTSKVSMKDAADFIYWQSINIYNKEWHDIDGNWFWVEVPMSEFNEASMEFFGRTYDFKQLDGQSLIISPYFPMEDEVKYDASKDALIITCSYGGGGGGEFDFPTKELKVIDDNTCTITMTYTQTTTKTPTMDIPYEIITYEYDCLTYYRYTTVEDITLTYVDGHWQYVSYIPLSY